MERRRNDSETPSESSRSANLRRPAPRDSLISCPVNGAGGGTESRSGTGNCWRQREHSTRSPVLISVATRSVAWHCGQRNILDGIAGTPFDRVEETFGSHCNGAAPGLPP